MSAILPSISIDSTALLSKYFLPYQAMWIQADDLIHAQGKQVCALAEKSVRIGWTFADAFKNVRINAALAALWLEAEALLLENGMM
jgi:phage FluMu gp28-like protein